MISKLEEKGKRLKPYVAKKNNQFGGSQKTGNMDM
jgi:hypothetical protein